ncbi:hypothetical protein EUX98_g7156 [Antrodiella citrinella]|uniref:Uncharacterized protein n=1 Tax=Antrodiella citrinella TaxID=2447956 RepID=A0A4S4MP77_9APHY|nr:hypothetical protein EUX98_g7156 [Antrodiella citrinella]
MPETTSTKRLASGGRGLAVAEAVAADARLLRLTQLYVLLKRDLAYPNLMLDERTFLWRDPARRERTTRAWNARVQP